MQYQQQYQQQLSSQQLLDGLDDGAHYVRFLLTRMRLDASHELKYVALAQPIEFLRQSTTINSNVMQMISLGTDHAGKLFCCIRLWIPSALHSSRVIPSLIASTGAAINK